MKLVVQYTTGDDYTWWATVTVPIEYESEEALLVDLEEHCKKLVAAFNTGDYKTRSSLEIFHGLCVENFVEKGIFFPPEIYTLDVWWEKFSS